MVAEAAARAIVQIRMPIMGLLLPDDDWLARMNANSGRI
jgi:hypothetical protein